MKTPYIPSKISRLFPVRLWALLILASLVFTACPPSAGPGGSESYSYTVTFDKNGGDTGASPQTKTVVSPAVTVGVLPSEPTRSGYAFGGWNTAANGTGTVFTATTPVTANITVYVQWGSLVSLRFSDPGFTAFDQGSFTVTRGGASSSRTITLSGSWTGGEWRVDGKVRETGTNSFTVNAADYAVGGHTLEVVVQSGSVPWSKTLSFTVRNE